MEVELEEIGPLERRLRIEIPTADVDASFERIYRSLGRSAQLKGFRPGRAPRSVLEKYFGETARSRVQEELVRDTLPRALEARELDLVGEPRLEPDSEPVQGMPYRYAVTLEVRPEIELVQVRGLPLVRPVLPEPDEDPVERHLARLREENAPLVEEEAGTGVARGHVAIVDSEASVDGRPFKAGSGHAISIDVGSGRTLPGLEDALLGLEVGGERDVELPLPEDHPDPELAGKRVHFHLHLVGIKRRELPELDDEFARDVSDFDTLEALRQDLRRRVEAGREAERERLLHDAAVRKLVELNPFPVPEGVVQRQLATRIVRAARQLDGRIPPDRLQALVEEWRQEWREAAERDVRLGFLIPHVAREHQIEVRPEEVDARLREIAEVQERSFSTVKREYREEGLREALESSLLEERVVAFLVSEATLLDA